MFRRACPLRSGVGSRQRGGAGSRMAPRILLCRRVGFGAVMSFVKWAGQAAMGVPFIWLGYEAFSEPGGRVALAENFGIPQPETVVKANGLAMVAGGTALVTNVLPRAAAVGLVASLLPTTLAGHQFWKYDDSQARAGQRIQVLKNLGLVGGLITIAARR